LHHSPASFHYTLSTINYPRLTACQAHQVSPVYYLAVPGLVVVIAVRAAASDVVVLAAASDAAAFASVQVRAAVSDAAESV
jgi:hypothetical protein